MANAIPGLVRPTIAPLLFVNVSQSQSVDFANGIVLTETTTGVTVEWVRDTASAVSITLTNVSLSDLRDRLGAVDSLV